MRWINTSEYERLMGPHMEPVCNKLTYIFCPKLKNAHILMSVFKREHKVEDVFNTKLHQLQIAVSTLVTRGYGLGMNKEYCCPKSYVRIEDLWLWVLLILNDNPKID